MMAFILATDFDFIAYMSKMAFFLEALFTPMAFLEYDYVYMSVLETRKSEVMRLFRSMQARLGP